MSEQFEARLMECLDALDNRGPGAGIDDILSRYPEDAGALRMTLGITDSLAAFDMQPDPDAQAASRRDFLAEAALLQQDRLRQPNSGGFFLVRAGAFLLAALVAGAIPVAASGNALPGDPLYGIKREVEIVQLQMAADPASREALAARINARRVQEVDDLVRDGRSAETEFEGRLDSTSPDALTVSGRTIGIPAGVHVPDLPHGTLVEVTVRVQDGRLVLVAITAHAEEDALTPTSTPTPEPALAPSDTPVPEPTQKGDDGGEKHTAEPTEIENRGETSGGEDGGAEIEPTHTDDGGDGSSGESVSGGDSGNSGDDGGSGSGGGHGGDDGGSSGSGSSGSGSSGSGGGDDGGGD